MANEADDFKPRVIGFSVKDGSTATVVNTECKFVTTTLTVLGFTPQITVFAPGRTVSVSGQHTATTSVEGRHITTVSVSGEHTSTVSVSGVT